jgi:hypothetical protein
MKKAASVFATVVKEAVAPPKSNSGFERAPGVEIGRRKGLKNDWLAWRHFDTYLYLYVFLS